MLLRQSTGMAHLRGGSMSRGPAASRIESTRAINNSLLRCKILLECGSTGDFTYDHFLSQGQGERSPRPTPSVLPGSRARTATALSHADHALDLASYYDQPQLVAKSQLFRGHCFRRMAQWDKAYWCYIRAASVREFAADKGPEGLEALTKECQRRMGRWRESYYSSASEEVSSEYGTDEVAGLRSRQEGVSETPAASDSSIEGRLDPTGKGKEKEIYPLELDLSDDDQHNRGYRRSSDNCVKETTDTVSGFPSLRSRRSSEAVDDTPTATSFKERMKSHFARVKSKDAALPTTSSRDLSEEQLELQRSEQQRDVEGFGPGEMLSTELSHSSLSPANRTASQHQHDKNEVCCTCDDKTSRSDRQQPTELKREPWWWVMQTGFYYLVYRVCCDFATAVHNGSQLSRWFVLGMMYLGSWLSSGAARLAIGKVAVWVDRDAARSLFGKMEQEFWKGYEAVQSVMADAAFKLGKTK
ncbi:hypothetical protein B0H65DRAFT_559114 [Neurospora tetraspora]|uniref:Uncharacterized protein n=1 Tax=Neurospora tetraspora TaxID=94610 RepID=A0AAE0JDR6_9PEZI|nr:hypothetical protein B0H65DRAFT_559114 [Neurospora tetraspora]